MKSDLYLVSNIHRSGSSMMMRCLEAGGMNVARDDSQMDLNTAYSTDYTPNPNGFYSLDADFEHPHFPETYSGRAVKFPFRSLSSLPPGNSYHLLFLRRDPEEIRASMAAFAPNVSWAEDGTILEFYDLVIPAVLAAAEAREDIQVVVLNYADVVKEPLLAFTKLKEAGWPLDPEAAAMMVDSSLHRFRLEAQ